MPKIAIFTPFEPRPAQPIRVKLALDPERVAEVEAIRARLAVARNERAAEIESVKLRMAAELAAKDREIAELAGKTAGRRARITAELAAAQATLAAKRAQLAEARTFDARKLGIVTF
jgi:hypothetical protein